MGTRKTSSTRASSDRIEIRLTTPKTSALGKVYRFLLSSQKLPDDWKTLVNDAITAFWKPFAFREEEDLSEAEKKEVALYCTFLLARQIDYLRVSFGLDPSQLPSLMSGGQGLPTTLAQPANGISGAVSAEPASAPEQPQRDPNDWDLGDESFLVKDDFFTMG